MKLRSGHDGGAEGRFRGLFGLAHDPGRRLHGDALSSVYCHASQLLVEDGDSVERDELVVLSGSTGRSTGPHLHFGLRIGRTWIDPLMVYRLQASARFGEPDGVVSSGP